MISLLAMLESTIGFHEPMATFLAAKGSTHEQIMSRRNDRSLLQIERRFVRGRYDEILPAVILGYDKHMERVPPAYLQRIAEILGRSLH